jgi:gluconokinase
MKIIVMGVAGSGKSTVGIMLARELGCAFFDADDFHSDANREKMARGAALTDEDRAEWLATLQTVLRENARCVLACSGLKEAYRRILAVDEQIRFVYLRGSYELIRTRLEKRAGHYMPVQLLKSQFDTLEEPADALVIDIALPPDEIIPIIRKGLNL